MKSAMETVSAAALTNIDLARLKAASDLHSSDWLHAASIASVGFKLADPDSCCSEAWSQSMLPSHLRLR